MNQHDDAIRLAQTYRKLDPANPSSLIFVRQVLQTREQQLIAAGNFEGAMAITDELNKIDPKNDHLIRRDHYQRQLDNENYFINAFTKNPTNPTNFVQAIYIHGRRGRTNEILTAINTFSPLAGEDPKNLTLIKNAYGLIQRWEDKALIDEKLTTSHPTTTPRGLIWRKPACNCSKPIAPLRLSRRPSLVLRKGQRVLRP